MTEVVLDASVVLKWFHTEGEQHAEAARTLRDQFEAGELRVVAPPLLWLEILNVAARRWQWESSRLEALAASLPDLGFELVEPDPRGVGRWTAKGLTAYDAAYVAVAEEAEITLVTDDREILELAPEIAEALSSN